MRRLPVAIRLRTEQELVLVVIVRSEADLADGDVGADDALVLGLIHELALAGGALETSPNVRRRQL